MTRHIWWTGLGLILMTLALVVPTGLAGGKLNPVQVTATAGKPDESGKQTITVKISIAKGWHIYANPVDNEEVDKAATEVTITAAGKPVAAKVSYPAGKELTDKSIGKFKAYEESVTIPAEIAALDSPFEIQVRFMVCNDKVCIPKTTKLKLP